MDAENSYSHTFETVERAFRMVEQLVRQGIDRAAAFAAFEAAEAGAEWILRTGTVLEVAAGVRLDGRPLTTRDLLQRALIDSRVVAAYAAYQALTDLMPGRVRDVALLEPGALPTDSTGGEMPTIVVGPSQGDQLIARLRAKGFDPITFDGSDPAAYLWAIMELQCRLEAASDTPPSNCHRPSPAKPALRSDRNPSLSWLAPLTSPNAHRRRVAGRPR